MSGFWWGVAIVAVLWLFFSMRSRTKAVRSFNAFDEADPWFLNHGINSDSARFSAYDEPGLARNLGATVLVGGGKDAQGERVGFALEVVSGKAVLCHVAIPSGTKISLATTPLPETTSRAKPTRSP